MFIVIRRRCDTTFKAIYFISIHRHNSLYKKHDVLELGSISLFIRVYEAISVLFGP
jgi:hypothetical protein